MPHLNHGLDSRRTTACTLAAKSQQAREHAGIGAKSMSHQIQAFHYGDNCNVSLIIGFEMKTVIERPT